METTMNEIPTIESMPLVSIKETLAERKISKSHHYEQVRKGLYPPPINIKGRAFYIGAELNLMAQAFISGADDAELRRVTKFVIAQREELRRRAAESVEAQLAEGAA